MIPVRVILEDLADAPVDFSQSYEVPEAFLSEGRPDEVVAAELADPEVQSTAGGDDRSLLPSGPGSHPSRHQDQEGGPTPMIFCTVCGSDRHMASECAMRSPESAHHAESIQTGTVDREEVERLARSLKAEMDRLSDEMTILNDHGQDFMDLWMLSKGIFKGYKGLADILGWQ